MSLNFAYSSAPLKTIQEIQFGLLSPEEIKNMSVVHVEYPETMDEQKRPREKGLNDPKLGTVDRQFNCATCGESQSECPGHFGHIELATPVFHVGFINKTKKLLETVCHSCSKILVDESNPQFVDALRIRDPKRRFNAIHRIAKAKTVCEMDPPLDDNPDPKEAPRIGHGGCGNPMPIIRKNQLRLKATYKPKKGDEEEHARTVDLTPQMALDCFRRISTDDVRKLGLSNDYARPEWMVITVLPVPPPPVRPSIVVEGGGTGMRSEDDLTYKLADIIRANSNVRRCEQEGSPLHILNEFKDLLQYHTATYMDNNIAGVPQAQQKSGRAVKSIRARLKGKEGRLRGNLMGKRVDFSSRTVITGDPNLSLEEVGVPRSIARILTYPETVTPYNIAYLSQLVKNGPNEHPGAKHVIRDDGQRINLLFHKGELALQYGWKVERHIVDGDFVIFNRQPSLHKESMMGHRVRVMPYSTFRLNLSVTSPYNADFDGDEMNLHAPQSHEARAEIRGLCMVPLNIVSPQKNGPLMGIVQDTLCGIYKICRRDVFMTREQVMNILMWVPDWDGIIPPPAILKPRPRWTGKQIISMIVPPGLNLLRGSEEGMNPLNDDGLFVSNGELMFGLFSKQSVGSGSGGVIHIVFNEKGPEEAVKFFNGAQKVVNYWLLHNGFSIGIGDTIPDDDTVVAIQDAVDKRKNEVAIITEQAVNNELETLPGMNIRETFESKVAKELNQARDDAGKTTTKRLKDLNNATAMARSGSKGSEINIAQMTAVVGQQSVEGKRIPFGFKYRTLPHFTKDDYSPESRGFVENSYLRGLTPTEFFFHAMAGREGLIDTAVKTAETGYIQRRLVKALEDVMTKYDGTVRNSMGDIVQFIYGEDGLDAVNIEKQRLDTILMSHAAFEKKFKVDVMDANSELKEYLDHAGDIIGDVGVQQLFDEEFEALNKDREWLRDVRLDDQEMFQLPLNIQRMIETAKVTFRIKDGMKSDLRPEYAITKVKEMIERLIIVRGGDPISQEAQNSATMLSKALFRSKLAFKRVVQEYSLNRLAFDNILGDLENRFARSLVSPGEMVGVVAAQSIGEPATQMTLNTFHFTGISSKNVTLGVPRLREILNVAPNIKTPGMKVFQSPENSHSQEACKLLRSRIEHTTLRAVTASTEVYYDPVIETTVIEEDVDMVESYFIIPEDIEEPPELQSKWLLRIVLNRKALLDKGLTAQDVANSIKQEYPKDLTVIFSDENADEQIIRIRAMNHDNKTEEDEDTEEDHLLKQLETHILDTLTLRGVPGVEKAFIFGDNAPATAEDGRIYMNKDDDACKHFILDTSGIALSKVLEVEGVDPYRTSSNSFLEVLEVFGIEACRAALMKELHQVLSFDGSYVNHRHLALLVDVMTARGHLMAVTRHGINRADTGALMRCSFEETVEILLEAAAIGELDDCRAVSENVLLGQLAPAGTGEMEVLLDQDMLMTVASDDPTRQGFIAGTRDASGMNDGAATPYDIGSPLADGGYASPDYGASFSPMGQHGGDEMAGGLTAYGRSNDYDSGFASPGYSAGAASPAWGGASPFGAGASPSSPAPYSPYSPGGYSPTSPALGYGATSPAFGGVGAASPAFALTSPGYASPSSPQYGSPTSPAWSPHSPAIGPSHGVSPTSPSYSPTSPSYSPTSPSYSPTSPNIGGGQQYSPASPAYSPTSPSYSPTSPAQHRQGSSRGGLTQQSPTSPAYSPTSPSGNAYSPTSPALNSPTSPQQSAQSPQWTPTSPAYSPSGN